MVEEISEEANDAVNQSRTARAWLLDVEVKPDTRRQLSTGLIQGTKNYTSSYEYITDWEEEIEFPEGSGIIYKPMPLEMPDFHLEQGDKIQKSEIKVSLLSNKFAEWLDEHDGLVDNIITAHLVVPGYQNKNDQLHQQSLRIKKSSTNGKTARFQVASVLDKLRQTITRKITRDEFPHIPKRRTIIR